MRKVKTIFACFFQVNLANLLKYQSHLADLLVSGWVQRAQLWKMTHTRTVWTKLDFYSTRNVVNPLLFPVCQLTKKNIFKIVMNYTHFKTF